MTRKTLSLAGITLAIAMAAPGLTAQATAGEKVMLKSHYKTGEKSYLQSRGVVIQDIKSPMGAMNMTMNQMRGTVQTVKSSSADGTELVMAMDRVSFAMDAPMMGELKYDSDIPSMEETPNLRDLFKPMLGEELTFTLDKDNKVKQVKGVAELIKKVEESSPANPFVQGFKLSFTEEHAKSGIDQLNVAMLPNKEVEVGATWKAEVEEALGQLGMSAFFDCTFKLDRIGDHKGRRCAFVSFSGKDATLKKSVDLPGGGLPENLAIKHAEAKGDYIFDIQSGTLVSRTLETACEIGTPDKPKDKEGEEPAGMTLTAKITAKHSDKVKSMNARETERKKNEKIAAEVKAKEEKEFDGESDDEDDSDE